MNTTVESRRVGQSHELCFRFLHENGKAMAFPCTATGDADMDSLSDQARCNSPFARAVVGRQFAWPAVQVATAH